MTSSDNAQADKNRNGSYPRAFIRALRPYQWVKNFLLFLPLLTAQAFTVEDITSALLGFVAFSLAASGTYLLNDLMDLESDRNHIKKRHRPFASGAIPVTDGYVALPVLLIASIYIGSLINWTVVGLLLAYFIANLFYSTLLKRLIIVDVIVLSGFYALRVFTGAATIGVVISPWLLMFSLFLFLSLAIIKRLVELVNNEQVSDKAAGRRGYISQDIPMLSALGAGSGFGSVLVIGLYINSEDVRVLYDRPEALWLICPLLLYWISRALLLAHRGDMHSDPVVFALLDRASQIVALLGLVTIAVATFL